MKRPFWEPISLDLELRDLTGSTLLALAHDDALIIDLEQGYFTEPPSFAAMRVAMPHWVTVEYWRPSKAWSKANLMYERPTKLREMLSGRLNAHTVMVIPRVRTLPNQRGRIATLLTGAFAVLFLTLLISLAVPPLAVTIIAALLIPTLVCRSRPDATPHIVVAGQRPLALDEAVHYGRARLDGRRPEVVRRDDRARSAEERVARIRASYGEAKLDIVRRIEQPALFDQAAPATAAFLEALAKYEDAGSLDERERAAADVEMTYSVALDHAKAVGLNHLPEHARDAGRRAAKAARLAAQAATGGERDASLQQVKRILDSLALYYLPTLDEQLAVEPPPES